MKTSTDLDLTVFELECGTANLNAVHSQMEADGGANWQQMCNALYASHSNLYNIHKELRAMIDAEGTRA